MFGNERARNTIRRWKLCSARLSTQQTVTSGYVLLNVTDAQVDFSYCNTPSPSYNSCTALRHKQNINKSRPKPSGVLLLDVSYTLGSNLLLQVAPYKPSVPSQVSHIKKTKPLRMEVQQVVFFSLCSQHWVESTEGAARGDETNRKTISETGSAPQNKPMPYSVRQTRHISKSEKWISLFLPIIPLLPGGKDLWVKPEKGVEGGWGVGLVHLQ